MFGAVQSDERNAIEGHLDKRSLPKAETARWLGEEPTKEVTSRARPDEGGWPTINFCYEAHRLD